MKTRPLGNRKLEQPVHDVLGDLLVTRHRLQGHRRDGERIGVVVDPRAVGREVRGRPVNSARHALRHLDTLSVIGERTRDIGRHRVGVLQAAIHLPVDQEVIRPERAILVLPRDQHPGATREHSLINVADLTSAGEGREHKGAEPQAALGAAKGREAAIVALVGQLPLVAGVDEKFRLDTDLGTQLSHLTQVLQDLDVRSQEDHVLLAAAIGHLQKISDVVHGLGDRARGDVQIGALRAVDHVGWKAGREIDGLSRLDHAVEYPLRRGPLGDHLDRLAHGIDPLGA